MPVWGCRGWKARTRQPLHRIARTGGRASVPVPLGPLRRLERQTVTVPQSPIAVAIRPRVSAPWPRSPGRAGTGRCTAADHGPPTRRLGQKEEHIAGPSASRFARWSLTETTTLSAGLWWLHVLTLRGPATDSTFTTRPRSYPILTPAQDGSRSDEYLLRMRKSFELTSMSTGRAKWTPALDARPITPCRR
jgi:hypothetical protein